MMTWILTSLGSILITPLGIRFKKNKNKKTGGEEEEENPQTPTEI